MKLTIRATDGRNSKGIPAEWVKMIKNSIRELAGTYNTGRMVKDYCEKFYLNVK